jgi:penicillin-binding protein 1A
VGEVFREALRNRWIDPRAEFGAPRTGPVQPDERLRDAAAGWTVREVFGELAERVRSMFR